MIVMILVCSILVSLLEPGLRRGLSTAEKQSVSDIAAQLLVQSYNQDPDFREAKYKQLKLHLFHNFKIYRCTMRGEFEMFIL